MAKIALLVPREEMYHQAHDVLQDLHRQVFTMRVIRTENAVSEARRAIRDGAEIIIARGIQATLIKQYTDCTVVEIMLTREKVEELLFHARKVLGKECPSIAIVILHNMACSTDGLEQKCGVKLMKYYVQNLELLSDSVRQAAEDGADLILGGETVLQAAQEAGLPSLFLTSDPLSIRNALEEADRLGKALEEGPIRQRKDTGTSDETLRREAPFVQFPYVSEKMQRTVDIAKRLSRSYCPKLIIEPDGYLYRAMASAIHNLSPVSRERMVVFECQSGEDAWEKLFGAKGIFPGSGRATVRLDGIEYLDRKSQRALVMQIRTRHVIAVTRLEGERLKEVLIPELYYCLKAYSVRIPALRETPEEIVPLAERYLKQACEKNGQFHIFSADAKKVLGQMPWRGGRMQLATLTERMILCADRRILRGDAVERTYRELYPEEFAGAEEDIPANGTAGAAAGETSWGSGREKVQRALLQNMGNREKAAKELGISKATLWRRMKKYGL